MYKKIGFVAALAVAAASLLTTNTNAAFQGMPKALLRSQSPRITLAMPTLPPIGHSLFCVQYQQECEVRRMVFRPTKFELTVERWNQLAEVNQAVNRRITPERNLLGLAGERWIISPVAGDCNDYAVTKRYELLARGWPSRTLLLAEVVTRWGEHHLVLVIRATDGDYVLDNLHSSVRPWSTTPYKWVRIQTPANPRFWSTLQPA